MKVYVWIADAISKDMLDQEGKAVEMLKFKTIYDEKLQNH